MIRVGSYKRAGLRMMVCEAEFDSRRSHRASTKGPGIHMAVDKSPLTRASLLVQLRDGANHAAWQEFVTLYGPVIYGFARQRGLQDADAADLMQDVLRSVSAAIARLDYDRNQGTFRGWLFTISRNKVFNFLSSRRTRPQAAGDTNTSRLLDSQPDEHDENMVWEMEYQRRLASLAMERIRGEFQPTSWQAFWLTAVEGQAAAEVSKQIGMSTGAIYVAKSRVLARLKEEVEEMQRQEES
jgi:RNA polymerase sigma-70 factor (ECF subfamily)